MDDDAAVPPRPDLDAIQARLNAAPRAPWHWEQYRHGPSSLIGQAGDPATYAYETEVIEAEHDGGCGCRSACDLDLTIAPGAADLIEHAPADLAALTAYVRHLEARLGLEPKD